VNSAKILVTCTDKSCTKDDWFGSTPMMYAAHSGNVELVRVLLEAGFSAAKASTNQWTPLFTAALFGYLDVCRLLLDGGAKVNHVNVLKDTPLHLAALGGHLSVVRLLYNKGADYRLKNKKGQTARDVARSKGNEDVAEWLDWVAVSEEY
jgi:ankyrin repeat protein